MDTIILCIGNKGGGDDGIGPYIAKNIPSTEKQQVINAGTTPENYTSIIRKNTPKKVIIIDAIDMQLPPGEIRIVPEHMIGVMHISTHSTPLSVLINYIKTMVKDVVLIGLQPVSYDGQLTNIVKKSGDNLVNFLIKQDISSISKLHD
jgi:hydrogenase 3 maturation protease